MCGHYEEALAASCGDDMTLTPMNEAIGCDSSGKKPRKKKIHEFGVSFGCMDKFITKHKICD